jgi:DNA-binding GntR family transcriptional regulator
LPKAAWSVRSQGSGTYVSEGRGAIDAPLHLRFRGGEGEPGFLPLFPKVLSRTRVEAAAAGPTGWGGTARTSCASIASWVSTVNSSFSTASTSIADTFPAIAQRPQATLDGVNLKQLLGEATDRPITDVEQHVSLIKFEAAACKAMGVKPGTRGLLLESAAAAGRGHPVYFLESFVPPNSRRLDVSPQ